MSRGVKWCEFCFKKISLAVVRRIKKEREKTESSRIIYVAIAINLDEI